MSRIHKYGTSEKWASTAYHFPLRFKAMLLSFFIYLYFSMYFSLVVMNKQFFLSQRTKLFQIKWKSTTGVRKQKQYLKTKCLGHKVLRFYCIDVLNYFLQSQVLHENILVILSNSSEVGRSAQLHYTRMLFK